MNQYATAPRPLRRAYRRPVTTEQRLDLLRVYGRRTVRRWHFQASDHAAHDVHLHLGWIDDGRWWVQEHSADAWVYTGPGAEAAARAKADQILAAGRDHPGRWVEVVAEYVPGTDRAADVPPRPPQ